MNNKWIVSFITVAQEGSVTAAAKKLYISPQALLQQINLIEEEVGTKLFSRDRSGMKLTLAGGEFLSGAQKIETAYAEAVSRCRLVSKAEDTIRIPMMSSIILPKFTESVCAKYRHSASNPMRIEYLSDEFGSWLNGLRDLKYDIAEHYAIDGHCPDGIHFERVSDVRSWCIMADFHPLAGKKMLKPEDLDSYTLLTPTVNMRLMRYLQAYIESKCINVKIQDIENDRYQIIDGLNRGGIYMADEAIAGIFVGFSSAFLDFDTHVQRGFACREEMFDKYKQFFEIAHEVSESM